jgi:hypothetical protein
MDEKQSLVLWDLISEWAVQREIEQTEEEHDKKCLELATKIDEHIETIRAEAKKEEREEIAQAFEDAIFRKNAAALDPSFTQKDIRDLLRSRGVTE